MSGRLIILPHKSWNVWNRDNVEKVQRDERLHKEEQERQQRQQRGVNQEAVLTKLKKRSRGEGYVAGEDGRESQKQDEAVTETRIQQAPEEQAEILQADGHINFFAEAEKQHRELAKNKEYELEKEARELLEKRRSGVAPWALGEEALEHKRLKPWYENQRDEMSVAAKQKEDQRKSTQDPMAHLLRSRQEDDVPGRPQCVAESAVIVADQPQQFTDSANATESSDDSRERRKSGKKHKKKSKEEKRDKKDKQKHRKSSRSSKSKERESTGGVASEQDEIALLRKRRMEREQQERKRAAVLLAEAQMASPTPLFSSRHR